MRTQDKDEEEVKDRDDSERLSSWPVVNTSSDVTRPYISPYGIAWEVIDLVDETCQSTWHLMLSKKMIQHIMDCTMEKARQEL